VSSVTSDKRSTIDISLASIPAFPTVVLRVLDIVSKDDPDFDLLVREIASDATLSAQVLRLANSPLFGFAAEIGTVQHAVVALGAAQVQSLVMSVATANYSRAALRTEALQKVWRHAVASAILSREVARAAGMPLEQAYCLGLLHDIGRLGLLVAWPDDYNLILQEADRDSMSLLDLERRLFGKDHCEVGRLLVEQWKLPPEFRVVAGRHHDPPTGMLEVDNLKVAWLGCQLADSLGYWVAKPLRPVSLEELLCEMPPSVRDRFPADTETLKALVERSVTGGADALNRAPQSYVSTPPDTRVSRADRNFAAGDENDVPKNQGLDPDLERKPLVWDFAIVLASVLTFAAVLVALHFLAQP